MPAIKKPQPVKPDSLIPVDLPVLLRRTVELKVESLTPLISHAWNEEALHDMFDRVTKSPSGGKKKRDPFREFEGSLYKCSGGGFGLPAPAFKACAVTAANDVKLKQTEMRRAFHVNTYTIRVKGPPITTPVTEWDKKYWEALTDYRSEGISMRMDVGRNKNGGADLRFRAWWPTWSCVLPIEINEAVISTEQLVNLFNVAGYGVGVGDYRPSSPSVKSGEFGRFKIV